jgi:tetratricopeptide (TPR) repeat protein
MWMRLVCALVAGWLALGSRGASAQPAADEDIARAHWQAGSGYFETGDYEAAVREFERSYALSPEPQLLYGLYASHERLGDWAEATRCLQEYLRTADEVPNRPALEARLANLKKRLEPRPAPVAPPAPEPPAEKPPEVARPAVAADEPGRSERFAAALASFAVAGAGAVTFGIAGGLALQEDRAVAERCGREAGRTCRDGDLRALQTRSTVADVGLSVLVVGSLVGITLFWLDRRAEAARAARSLRPFATVGADGGSLLVGGRF